MKAAKITVGEDSYFLVLDGEAMFQIRDDFGGTKLLLEAVEPDTREAFEATCAAAALLAERGELIRRRLGYEPGKIPERDDFRLLVRPFEVVDLKNAVIRAITLGYGREVEAEDGGEYDEGLEELNQKKHHTAGGILPRSRPMRAIRNGGAFHASGRGFRPMGALP